MATEYLFSNNATTTLAQSVSSTATVLNVASGDGSMFPNPGQGQAFAVTLVDAATGLTNEICYCTSRSGDQLTVVRGREGTNAVSWQAGDTCANYITADVMESWLQESDLNGYVTETEGDTRYLMLSSTALQTVTGPVTFSGNLSKDAPSGSNAQMQVTSGGSDRWNFGRDADTESGASTGSNFVIARFNNAGNYIDVPFSINRETGIVSANLGMIVPDITDFTDANALNARTAEGRYVGKATGSVDYPPIDAGVNKTTGNPWLSYNDGSGVKFAIAQQAGDYATNTALNAEITNRTSADTNLDNTKVNRDGDKMTGTLTIEGATSGFVTQYNPGSPSSGTYINYPGLVSIAEGRGAEFYCQLQEVVGTRFSGLFSLKGSNGNWRYIGIPEGLRINDSQYGDVAYTSDLSNYVPTSTYTSDFATSDSRVINLPYGHRIQAFTVYVDGNGSNSHRITYPQAFSGNSTVTFNCNDTGQSRSVSLANGTTPDSTGFNISVSVHGNSTAGSTDGLTLTVIAIGPK